MGSNPCDDDPAYPGAFRTQDPERVNGKVIVISIDQIIADSDVDNLEGAPAPTPYRVVSTGHRNPFRLSVFEGVPWVSETGWYWYEEINRIEQGKNYGWPCYEGIVNSPHYQDDNWHGVAVCHTIPPFGELPYHYKLHPQPPPPGNIMSFSAILVNANFVLYGDYTMNTIDKIPGAADLDADLQTPGLVLGSSIACVELRALPDGTVVYVNHDRGVVAAFDVGANPQALTASASPIPPVFTIIATPDGGAWTPGSGSQIQLSVGLGGASQGREGFFIKWSASFVPCNAAPSACVPQVLFSGLLGDTEAILAPAKAGTLRITAVVSSLAGFSSTTSALLPGGDVSSCSCALPSTPGGGGGGGVSTAAANGPLSQNGIIGVATAGGVVVAAAFAFLGIAIIRRRRTTVGGNARAATSVAAVTLAANHGRPPLPPPTAPTSSIRGNPTATATAPPHLAGTEEDEPHYKTKAPPGGIRAGSGEKAAFDPMAAGGGGASAPNRTPQAE